MIAFGFSARGIDVGDHCGARVDRELGRECAYTSARSDDQDNLIVERIDEIDEAQPGHPSRRRGGSHDEIDPVWDGAPRGPPP